MKPKNIKIVIVVQIIRLVLIAFIIIATALLTDTPAGEKSVAGGMSDVIAASFGLGPTIDENEWAFVFGKLILPIIFTMVVLACVFKRSFWPAVIAASLDVLMGLGNGLPIVQVLVLILICIEPAQSYLKRKDEKLNIDSFGKPDPEQ